MPHKYGLDMLNVKLITDCMMWEVEEIRQKESLKTWWHWKL